MRRYLVPLVRGKLTMVKSTLRIMTVVSCIELALMTAGCADLQSRPRGTPSPQKPELRNLTGWAGKPYHSYNNKAEDADIDGEVGHPLSVSHPRMKCVGGDGWSGESKVVSGTLPPGLTLHSSDDIDGIPTERGHWVVRLREYNLTCGGNDFGDFEQELRFHISGSGKVIQ